MKRREFLLATGATLVGVALPHKLSEAVSPSEIDLEEEFRKLVELQKFHQAKFKEAEQLLIDSILSGDQHL